MTKVKKSDSERQRESRINRRKKTNYKEYASKENRRIEDIRKDKVQSMTLSQLQKYRESVNLRKRQSRQRLKMESLNTTPEILSDVANDSPSTSTPYRTTQALGKAVKRVKIALPFSPRKKRIVISALAKQYETVEIPSVASTKGVPEETKENVRDFYFRVDISYTMPGMKDMMTVWDEKGHKIKLTKHYMNMFIDEAFAIYKDEFKGTDLDIQRSMFFKLRPKNVLLLNDSPKDQCKCQTHENFFLQLEALGVKYISEIWDTLLCDTSMNSDCWLGLCSVCAEAAKFVPQKAADQSTVYKQWESIVVDAKNDEDEKEKDEDKEKERDEEDDDDDEEEDQGKAKKVKKRLAIRTKEVCAGEVLEELQNKFKRVTQHVNVKRIQAKQFQHDISDPEKRVVQIDYAMSYQCEWQDEIQSALWHRCSVALFTVAVYVGEIVQTALIVSDIKNKNKCSTWSFIDHIYSDIIQVSPDDTYTEIIWSDGPTSEFKNCYMVKSCSYLSQKYDKKWMWKYTATSHGKGVVDGIGGRAKSLVRMKTFSKGKDRVIVQSAYDFYSAVKKLMKKTNVSFITQEMIDEHSTEYPLDDAPKVNGISKTHVIEIDRDMTKMWRNSACTDILNTCKKTGKSGTKEPSATISSKTVTSSSKKKNTARKHGKIFRKELPALLDDGIESDDDDESIIQDSIILRKIRNCQKAIDDEHKEKFFCIYYDENRFWGRLKQVFADDADADANQVQIDFLEYRMDGFWDFPKKRNTPIIDVKFVIYGPVISQYTGNMGYRFKEDSDALNLYNKVKKVFKKL